MDTTLHIIDAVLDLVLLLILGLTLSALERLRAQSAGTERMAEAAHLTTESVHGKLDLAIAALPRKRKPRAKAEPGEVSHQALTDGVLPKEPTNG